MKKDTKWLKNEMRIRGRFPAENEYVVEQYRQIMELINQLDEPELPVIPQFVVDYIEAHDLHGNNPLMEYRDLENDFNEGWTDEEDAAVYHWINKNPYAFVDALRYGYEVEKEILWEIPMPDLKTSDGHIQYLTYDTKMKTYFAGRKNGRLKQTFNAKDLASVPEQYRYYAELCDFKKIEEEV